MITKLEAVNMVLMAQGLSPASTLEGDVSKDTLIAIALLDQTTSVVQNERFHWNSDWNYTLSLNEAGEIPYPSELARFVVPGESWIVMKDGKMYDRRNKTFTFTSALSGQAMFKFDFESLPPAAQSYVAHRTARLGYEQYMGTDETRQNLFLEEQSARAVMEQEDAENASYNMLNSPELPPLYGSHVVPGTPKRGFY